MRIFPALIVLVLLTTFVFAPLLSSKTAADFFSHSSTWLYAFNNIILRPMYKIDGVFEALPYPSIINGSLWTLPYEFSFYAGLALLFFAPPLSALFWDLPLGCRRHLLSRLL